MVSIKSATDTEKAVKDKSPMKGTDFEDELLSLLEEYASINGDIVEDLTKKSAILKGAKKGILIIPLSH